MDDDDYEEERTVDLGRDFRHWGFVEKIDEDVRSSAWLSIIQEDDLKPPIKQSLNDFG